MHHSDIKADDKKNERGSRKKKKHYTEFTTYSSSFIFHLYITRCNNNLFLLVGLKSALAWLDCNTQQTSSILIYLAIHRTFQVIETNFRFE